MFCSSDLHDNLTCPMFGKTEVYLKAYAPSVSSEGPVNRPRPSFAPTQLEQIYGADYENVLADAIDDPDLTSEQRILAMEVVTGIKDLKKLDPSDLSLLDGLTHHVYAGGPRKTLPVDAPKRQTALPTLLDPHMEDENTIDDLRPYSPKDEAPVKGPNP